MEEIKINPEKHYIGKACVKCESEVRYIKGKACVSCTLASNKRYVENNKEDVYAKRKEWRDNNQDHLREYRETNKERRKKNRKRYYQENKEREKENSRKWWEENYEAFYEKDRVKILGRSKIWRDNNPAKIKHYKRERRARESNAEGSFTTEEFIELCNFYGNRCLACGCDDKLTADHVIPLIKGGTNYIWNIQPLCLSCNDKKARKIIDYRPKENIPQEYIDFLASLE